MKIALPLRLILSGKFNPIVIILLLLLFLWSVPLAIADTTVGGTIATDTTWTLAESPYIVTSNIIVQGVDGVDGITTVTIEPGVEVRFNRNRYMNIGGSSGNPGSLVAQGTVSNPIVFTSNAATPAAGDWYGLRFMPTTDAASTLLEHCTVQYAGYANTGSIYINGASPTLSNTTVENSSNYDLYYTGTVGGTVSNCTLNSGIYLLATSSVNFTGNTFNQNNSYPIKAYADNVHALANGNTFANLDAASHLEISSGNVTKDATWTSAIPYYLVSNITAQGNDGADEITTLTIEAGATLRFNINRYMNIGGSSGNPGAIKAQGTSSEPILFTSSAASPAAGNWYGLRFMPTTDAASTLLEHCTVQYAGYANTGSIYINSASPTLNNTTVENSSNYDLYYTGTVGGTVSNCTLNSGIYLLATSSVNFTGNTFNQNNSYPIKAYADNVHALANGNTFANLDAASHLEISSGNVTKDATWTSAIPYYLVSNITVQGNDGADEITTLTIEAGATLRFNINRYMNIGGLSGNPGAIKAQGTSSEPILFTSSAASPATGNWYGLRFMPTTDAASALLEHCTVQYAGYANTGSIYINGASPTLSNTTVENSSNYDLYYTGTVGGAVSNCTLNSGIYLLATSSVSFTGNTFNQNNSYPIKAYADNVHALANGNTFANLDEASHLEINSGNVTKDATWTSAIPYYIVRNITVQGNDGADEITTLTIEAGATLRFNINRYMNIGGSSGNSGALVAQGAADNLIVFTSNKATPAAGDWGGVRFYPTANDATSVLEYSTVEYAGYGNQGAVYLYQSKPAVRKNTIRNNLLYALYIYGTGANDADIQCNNIENNGYGVYTTGSAAPILLNNNFKSNSSYGVYNASSAVTLTAENNWWNDAAGPNTGGDATYGNVDAEPWSINEYPCITTGGNTAPNIPNTPTPEDNSVRVPISGGITLNWIGGDPDPDDTVTYDLYWGASPESLNLKAQDLSEAAYLSDDPVQGTTYYWQIAAKDSAGAVVTGPVWRFTTDGGVPDLSISDLSFAPSAILQAGQTVTFTATIQNTGGPVLETFSVDLRIDGVSMGAQQVEPILYGGGIVDLNWTWTYTGTDLDIVVNADSQSQVSEADEANNSISTTLIALANDPSNSSATPTQVTGVMNVDTIWTLSGSPFVVTGSISVSGTDGADGVTTLTIEPGVEVRFSSGTGLTIGADNRYPGSPGALIAKGTEAAPIVFTSDQATPTPGAWRCIIINNTINDTSTVLEHCVVQYAGAGNLGQFLVINAAPTLANCTFNNSSNYDLYYSGTVSGSVTDCTLNSGVNMVVDGDVNFSGNTFYQNNAYPSYVNGDNVDDLTNGNTFENLDADSHIFVANGTVRRDAAWSAGIPIYMNTDLLIQGDDGPDGITTLTIEPGVEIRLNSGNQVTVGTGQTPGALAALGTSDNPIVFTSNEANPSPGDWKHIRFNNASNDQTSILKNCIINYAGGNSSSSVFIDDAGPTLQNTTIAYSKNYDLYYIGSVGGKVANCTLNNGIYINGTGFVDFTGNTINQNDDFPVWVTAENAGGISSSTFNNLTSESHIVVTGDEHITKDAVWTANIPFRIAYNITVSGTDGEDGVTTMTIEPGAVLKFGRSLYLKIGVDSGDPGALNAQGTADEFILFTSSMENPVSGDWQGIRFYDTADDDASAVNYCAVKYAGVNSSGAIYLNKATPATISHCALQYSAYAGIYLEESNSNIICNSLTDIPTGVYVAGTSQPLIEQNNFTGNNTYGVYNAGENTISAPNNWWGDPAGPNTGGDSARTHGSVNAEPWATAEHDCVTSGENLPPNTPSYPNPADNAARVWLGGGSIVVQWTGSDPNHQDTLSYRLNWGTSPTGLANTAQDIELTRYHMMGLTPGVTYYWQVIARDNAGLETAGPVWRFTTDGDPPDLTPIQITTNPPGNLQTGQTVTLITEVKNIGTGPVVDPFAIDMWVDGVSIGATTVDQVLLAGETRQISQIWTYDGGNPTIELIVDHQGQVSETDEANNSLNTELAAIADITAPALTGASPADGAAMNEIQQITVTLTESQSAVDDAAVTASFSVKNSGQQAVSGTVTESDDVFTFTPAALPLPDDTYQVSLTAVDTHGNSQEHALTFTIDNQPPDKPVITGATVTSGLIQPRPAQNTTDQFTIELTGTRETGTSLWANGSLAAEAGDAQWSVRLYLEPGDNTFEIWLKDKTGNQSESEWVDIESTTNNDIIFEYDDAGRVRRIHSNQ